MNNSINEVVILEATRTPIGAYKGSLKELSADKLGSIVIKEILRKTRLSKDDIDEVIMGQVLTAGGGQNPARQAAINAGINISGISGGQDQGQYAFTNGIILGDGQRVTGTMDRAVALALIETMSNELDSLRQYVKNMS